VRLKLRSRRSGVVHCAAHHILLASALQARSRKSQSHFGRGCKTGCVPETASHGELHWQACKTDPTSSSHYDVGTTITLSFDQQAARGTPGTGITWSCSTLTTATPGATL